ncbi:hypothetical protein SAMN05192558_101286 [Actinokineospora alba]|uniref:Uncharacterized protein n=1 Tax=Actinokineospora alba TaxID=504798 RepID=A0A1H0F9M5_9PSEU|nr:hypothetical protein [Actinokineospora alba]TDP69396.1 hypothetical protein C8E96_4982 [Actinokineospora alba]SDI17599.1 hypothetical protein SAMN05421871_103584 [Actinokineospora alba]SDN91343.1 hypothetical protein SAMN05192558_101286 [Actinokineospora alba]
MTHRPLRRISGVAMASVLVLGTLAVTPAQADTDTSVPTTATSTVEEVSEVAAQLGVPQDIWAGITERDRAQLTEIAPLFPDRRLQPQTDKDLVESPLRETLISRLRAAINPADYECAPTALNDYIDGLIAELSFFQIIVLGLLTHGLDYPTYDALFHGTPGAPDYTLHPDYADRLSRAFHTADRFWDVDTSDVQLLAMQGDMLADTERVRKMVIYFGDSSPAGAPAIAKLVVNTTAGLVGGYDNPLLTLNAYAFTAEGDPDPDVQGLPDKLVFGDGILESLEAIGLGDAGPQAVMGHEFGHHVQFELGQATGGSPELTRRSELEADFLATYFVAHKRGLARNDRRVVDSIVSFGAVGDCNFTSNGHHGTPNQRRKAAEAGAALAETGSNGTMLPAKAAVAEFAKVLPTILLPDAP